MVSFEANHRSWCVESAYSKQLRAKPSIEESTLCMPWMTPGWSKSWIRRRSSWPSASVKTSSALPAPGTRYSTFLYTSPYP